MPGQSKEVWWKGIYVCGNFGGGTQWNVIDASGKWIRGEGGEQVCRHYGYFRTSVYEEVQKKELTAPRSWATPRCPAAGTRWRAACPKAM